MSKVKAASAYASAGVDIDGKMKALRNVKAMVEATRTSAALSGIGHFGGLVRSPGANFALVASTDGVGTKLKVAAMAGRHDTVGQDLVNHCVNDILVLGAEPLFFLDYIGLSGFEPKVFRQVMAGLCAACKENSCALVGGETAEMPGLYPPGEYDLVGTIVGKVERGKIITGKNIREDDVIIGLASTGLHTNGYSLARHIIFKQKKLKINTRLTDCGQTVADALLAVHKSYLKPVRALLKKIKVKGMAHITGGGFYDNIPRVLPESLKAVIDTAAWTPPPIFRFLQEAGKVAHEEMHKVFNMGIGMAIIVRPADALKALSILKRYDTDPAIIGLIEQGAGDRVKII